MAGKDSGGGIFSYGYSNENASSTQTLDPKIKAYLDSITNNTDYSKEAAITDSQGAVQQTIKEALQMGAPAIANADKAAGGYNATTTALLGNDLTAKAAAAGQKTLLDTITSYAGAQAGDVNAAANAANATKISSSVDTKSAKNTSIGTVICTQLYRDGHLSRRYYLADSRYVREYLSENTQRGYRLWAVPLVRLMRRNKIAYAVAKYFGLRWSLHCASAYCHELQGNFIGAALNLLIVPICFILGLFITDTAYASLWERS